MSDVEVDDWITAAEAVQITKIRSGHTLTRQILERARDGIIMVRAEHFIVTEGKRGRLLPTQYPEELALKPTSRMVPPMFFWAASGDALETNWITGDFSTWIDNTFHCRAYGVQFRWSEIDAMTAGSAKIVPQIGTESALPMHNEAELEYWINQAPKTNADLAHSFYKLDSRYNGIKQQQFREKWKTIKETHRGRSKKP